MNKVPPLCVPLVEGCSSELDWIAKPPRQGEPRNPPTYERDLIAGGGLILGKGAFGVTRLAQSSLTGEYYAVKVLTKAQIFEKKTIVIVQGEVNVLARMQHPFIVHLFAAYQDEFRVVLVMEYAVGGELLHRIRQRPRLPDGEAKFYAAEIADALQYMHDEVGVIYHDLKPENIMVGGDGHIRVIDFGLALAADARQYDETRIGTSMYMAPELANHRVQGAHAPAVDWWSFGCVVYEMVSGTLPFGDSAELTKYELYTNITSKKLRFGKGFTARSRHMVTGLLDKNPGTRLGWEGVKAHRWFKNVDWLALREQRIRPPWVPTRMKPGDTGCFLVWKMEPEVSEKEYPSDQIQEYSRIKMPAGCTLRPPQPQKSKRNAHGSAGGNFHRVVLETMVNPATGARHSGTRKKNGGQSQHAPRGSGGVGGGGCVGGEPAALSNRGGGIDCRRGSKDSVVIGGGDGGGGGGNSKRRFRSTAWRVAAADRGGSVDHQHTEATAGSAGGPSAAHHHISKYENSNPTLGGGIGHSANGSGVSSRGGGVAALSGMQATPVVHRSSSYTVDAANGARPSHTRLVGRATAKGAVGYR